MHRGVLDENAAARLMKQIQALHPVLKLTRAKVLDDYGVLLRVFSFLLALVLDLVACVQNQLLSYYFALQVLSGLDY